MLVSLFAQFFLFGLYFLSPKIFSFSAQMQVRLLFLLIIFKKNWFIQALCEWIVPRGYVIVIAKLIFSAPSGFDCVKINVEYYEAIKPQLLWELGR